MYFQQSPGRALLGSIRYAHVNVPTQQQQSNKKRSNRQRGLAMPILAIVFAPLGTTVPTTLRGNLTEAEITSPGCIQDG
jgi:hypothetical protein